MSRAGVRGGPPLGERRVRVTARCVVIAGRRREASPGTRSRRRNRSRWRGPRRRRRIRRQCGGHEADGEQGCDDDPRVRASAVGAGKTGRFFAASAGCLLPRRAGHLNASRRRQKVCRAGCRNATVTCDCRLVSPPSNEASRRMRRRAASPPAASPSGTSASAAPHAVFRAPARFPKPPADEVLARREIERHLVALGRRSATRAAAPAVVVSRSRRPRRFPRRA